MSRPYSFGNRAILAPTRPIPQAPPRVMTAAPPMRAAPTAPGAIVSSYAVRGSTLAALRQALSEDGEPLSQRGLERRTIALGRRVSHATIQRIEQAGADVAVVTVDVLDALAAGLGCKREALLA